MTRSPSVLVFSDPGAALDGSIELRESLEAAHGLWLVPDRVGPCLVLPRPFEVRINRGRTLRSEEYAWFGEVCLDLCDRLAVRSLRFFVDELYPFDWDSFRPRDRQALHAAYASLPGWIGVSDLPRWFGEDDRLGPTLCASFEPPGLQVSGVLELSELERWELAFREKTAALPVRPLD